MRRLAYVTTVLVSLALETGCFDAKLERSDLRAVGGEGEAGEDGPKHAACSQPFPVPAPPEPDVDLDTLERDVNAWTTVSCDDVAEHPSCGPLEPCPADAPICLRPDEASRGVCVSDPHAEPPRVGVATTTSYREGRCVITPLLEEKAAACCRELPGFDCRTYPFARKSMPGERCGLHVDCEPGLVCSGVCACPGVSVHRGA